jgi:polysaccharide export outer membrane protein
MGSGVQIILIEFKYMIKIEKILWALFLPFLLFTSCNTSKEILYLQNIELNKPMAIEESPVIAIMPNDMLSIVVSSKDNELAALFNLPRVSYSAGSSDLISSSMNGQISGYMVDLSGNIDFPVLGMLHVEGLTRSELSQMIKKRLIGDDLLKDPIVSVDFMNLRIYVLGEVGKPGAIAVSKDRISVLEAISMAGDLTIYGKREGVYVIREKDAERTTFRLDLRSVELFASPVYYLQQNDIIYVEPNKVRAGQSTINENSLKSISLWMSVTSLLITLGVLFFK